MRSSRWTAMVISLVISVGILATSCASASTSAVPAAAAVTTSSATTAPTTTAPGDSGTAGGGSGATCVYPADGTPAKPVTTPAAIEPDAGSVTLTLRLTGGDLKIVMDRSKTPCTIGSFVHLATAGYFNGTTCHRLTTADSLKVLQCGDPTGTGTGGPGYSFADETNPSMTYPAGTVAMANSGANTNGSQFFLVYADSTLPPDYTVFGHLTAGLDILTKIAAAGVGGGGQDGAPASPITISTVTVS